MVGPPCKNRKSVSSANVYSCFSSISNAFYLYMVTARVCSSTPYRAHVRPTRRCGYSVRLSAPCTTKIDASVDVNMSSWYFCPCVFARRCKSSMNHRLIYYADSSSYTMNCTENIKIDEPVHLIRSYTSS